MGRKWAKVARGLSRAARSWRRSGRGIRLWRDKAVTYLFRLSGGQRGAARPVVAGRGQSAFEGLVAACQCRATSRCVARTATTAGRALGRVALGWCVVDPVEARWAGDRGRHAALCYGPGARWATAVVGRRRPPHLCGGLPSLVAPAQRVRGVTGHRRRGEGTATGCPPPCG
ncbi:hypothetical protein G6F24_015483 [Rhizopus arrhizus]|nr:hypothetical protein G6F24_015483 [Rhizopus arrhizus]